MTIRFCGSLAVLVALAACSSTRPAGDAPARASRVQAVVAPGDEDAATVGTRTAEAPLPPPGTPLAAVRDLWQARAPLGGARRTALEARVASEAMFRKAMATTLEARGHEFFFTTAAGPTPALEALTAAVRALPDHGRNASAYPVDVLNAAVERLRAAAGEAAESRRVLESTAGWVVVRDLIERKDPPTQQEIDGLDRAGRLIGMDGDTWTALSEAFRKSLEGEKGLVALRADVEVPAMAAFFRYALDMKFLIVASPFKADRAPDKADEKHHDDLVAAFDAFARDARAGLDALVPKHPYYAALQKGLAEYRRLATLGPFVEVKFKGKLKRGAHGREVEALQQRLAQEGYYAGPVDGHFGEALEKAVVAYQRSHGYTPDGVLEDRHQKSLNVPVEHRVRQIELSLQRWRESDIRPEEPLYIRVNIPEFHMEVWDEGKLALKHKVVTGNNNWDKDVDNRLEGRINRTKIFQANMVRVVLNPKWHVPSRIQREEINYDILKDPEYLAKHNFKVKVLPDGREEIYQDSGGGNALGRVKFVFPNPYGIFMHDTNLKEFFKRDIRAFSHGCIRLNDPFTVAYYLLEKAAGLTKERAEEILATHKQREVELDRKIPVFVEYNSVGVDAEGRVEFYSDVYGYDKDFFEGKIPYSEEELRLLHRKIPKVG